MSLLTTPRWFLLLLTALVMQATLMLADVIFVFHYATFANPGLEQAAYSAFAAQTAGAFVFCFAPPVVYLITAWLCRKVGKAPLLHAGLLVALYYVLDVLIVIAFVSSSDTEVPMRIAPYLLNGLAILGGALLAGWHARAGMAR